MTELDPEDAKIVTLARAARQRGYAPRTGRLEGAAVRDTDGRTYTGATVEYADRALSALTVAVATAVGSGARRFEAAAVVGDEPPDEDKKLLDEFGGAPVIVVAP